MMDLNRLVACLIALLAMSSELGSSATYPNLSRVPPTKLNIPEHLPSQQKASSGGQRIGMDFSKSTPLLSGPLPRRIKLRNPVIKPKEEMTKASLNHQIETTADRRQQGSLLDNGGGSWSNPPNMNWIDDPPADGGANLLPILYFLAPLVITALLMPIGASMIATALMVRQQHSKTDGTTFIEHNFLSFLRKLEEAIEKYGKNMKEES